MELSPLWKPSVAQILQNFATFYETRRFITVFKRALHCFLSWARSVQSILIQPISLRSILIISSHLCLALSSSSFLVAFPPKLCMHSFPPPPCVLCPSHLSLLYLGIQIIFGEKYELMSRSAEALGSWVRVPLETWMYAFLLGWCLPVQVAGGQSLGWSPVQGVLPTAYKINSFRINPEWE
jgi:hypothetical protein